MTSVRQLFCGGETKRQLERRRPGIQPAVKVVLAGDFCQPTPRATLKTQVLSGFKSSEKTGVFPV